MTYYQLLKQRRQSFNLSIEDVSNQTRLDPNFIQAIEEHNLEVFSDDYSFVRYFIHAYCDAIGVNWNVIQVEVDADIHEYARNKNQALTQAQRKLASSMKPASSTKSKKTHKNKSLSKWLSYKITGSYRFSRIISIGVAALVVLIVFNTISGVLSTRQQAAYEQQVEKELAQKEKETTQLAKQFQQEKEKKAIKFETLSKSENQFRIYNLSEARDLQISITLPEETSVMIYVDGVLVSGSETLTYIDDFTDTINVSQNCTITIALGTYSNNVVTIENEEFTFDEEYWYEGTPAEYTFEVEFNNSDSQEETQEETQDENIQSEQEEG
ncbi:MAG: helix-turn-helix domain-containing protein [Erysipelotrichaceae bacterium]|uniref:helix-turn-helix domain-containing protein n=1 Tax=Floccifex sp. TaxID=2815810 RepID=UPI002A748104|nr:helix-turn-helix domain-containing protein [Floccifex sp.]MDD7281525.1 helix-turn-helix domain-containing protein [Erysipelotrichaceae bacterium]MDY2957972.1 helix-turn-helix domain-containing protein [Floccifex sp.]